jgi:hypothetical protein
VIARTMNDGVGIIAGRSQLRRATLSLPTHREVVAAAFRISALGAPFKRAPGSRAFPAACLHSTPPRFDSLPFEELHKPKAVMIVVTRRLRATRPPRLSWLCKSGSSGGCLQRKFIIEAHFAGRKSLL